MARQTTDPVNCKIEEGHQDNILLGHSVRQQQGPEELVGFSRGAAENKQEGFSRNRAKQDTLSIILASRTYRSLRPSLTSSPTCRPAVMASSDVRKMHSRRDLVRK